MAKKRMSIKKSVKSHLKDDIKTFKEEIADDKKLMKKLNRKKGK